MLIFLLLAAAAAVPLARPRPFERDGEKAFWLTRDTIAVRVISGSWTYELHYASGRAASYPESTKIVLQWQRVLTNTDYAKFPNIGGYYELRIPSSNVGQVESILRSGGAAVATLTSSGSLLEFTGLQIQGVLDDMFTFTGALGVTYSGTTPSVSLWAPTAQSVTLERYATSTGSAISTHQMTRSALGVWSVVGAADWTNTFYTYLITVYVPNSGRVETLRTTDPYSVSLSLNSLRSQIVDAYNDPELQPTGWNNHTKPALDAFEDIVVYELHVRDFSINDSLVPQQYRGKFLAFDTNTVSGTNGQAHLSALQQAGLTHVHLLPFFDIATIDEDVNARVDPDRGVLSQYSADSEEQQRIVGETRYIDSFNWGYDPFHYSTPEGSYSVQLDGKMRIKEFRSLVLSLNKLGLRVVMDVVYNHVAASGISSAKSVFDKIVPGYFMRYDNNGVPQTSTCCPDTASEFSMTEKLMIDSLLTWSTLYRIDGFRFDLMGHHTVSNLQRAQSALRALTLQNDGVDGSKIYLYGEGWAFGSGLAKGLYIASQWNIAGNGIGTFNDRIRDAIHGGSRTDPLEIRAQGYINGISYDWNGYEYSDRYRDALLYDCDVIKVGLAGNLRNFQFTDRYGNTQTGQGLNGVGYTLDPQESIQYASSHDDQTLFDLNVFKAPSSISFDQRVRIQMMALSVIGLSQGIPFFHGGVDLLRSKSLDRNSYDSGDWFNTLDMTYTTNNFGVGMPPAWENTERYSIIKPLLQDTRIRASKSHIVSTTTHLREILRIRKSTPLFRLTTESAVTQRVSFYNNGPSQQDAIIVYQIRDVASQPLPGNEWERVVVVFNADKFERNITVSQLQGVQLTLHPVQQESADPIVRQSVFSIASGSFLIPARTTAVFVEN